VPLERPSCTAKPSLVEPSVNVIRSARRVCTVWSLTTSATDCRFPKAK
jgi:hypothetical protein